MLRAQPPLHRTGADFHRSADTASDTVEKRKEEGLYLFGMWGTGVAPAVTFCQHGCTSDQAGRGCGHSIGKKNGRAHDRTPVTNTHLVCRLQIEQTTQKNTHNRESY